MENILKFIKKHWKTAIFLIWACFLVYFIISYLDLFYSNIKNQDFKTEYLTSFVTFIGILAAGGGVFKYLEEQKKYNDTKKKESDDRKREAYFNGVINDISKEIKSDTNVSGIILSIYRLRHNIIANRLDGHYFIHSLIYLKEDLSRICRSNIKRKHIEKAIDNLLAEFPRHFIKNIEERILNDTRGVISLLEESILSVYHLKDFIKEEINDTQKNTLIKLLGDLQNHIDKEFKHEETKNHLKKLMSKTLQELGSGQIAAGCTNGHYSPRNDSSTPHCHSEEARSADVGI